MDVVNMKNKSKIMNLLVVVAVSLFVITVISSIISLVL
ncbi:hypothetical protein lbkm_1330 [Lachnospiraceae bacterium KM106-2]|nr:hypothetical protein lbkm_1330 [Lachnospiraceae bacterium KM106-2]